MLKLTRKIGGRGAGGDFVMFFNNYWHASYCLHVTFSDNI